MLRACRAERFLGDSHGLFFSWIDFGWVAGLPMVVACRVIGRLPGGLRDVASSFVYFERDCVDGIFHGLSEVGR